MPDPRPSSLANASGGLAFIAVEQVSKAFRTERRAEVQALLNVSFDVAEGEFISLLGPSGCGKSTLLRLVAGLLPPTEGQVRIGGHRVSGPRTDLGIVFQTPILMDWRTVLGNVLLQVELRGRPAASYRERAQELLSLVGLEGWADRRPYELSGGMKQRTAICRALVHDPHLLLMDEPFGSLDAMTREQLQIDIERLWMKTKQTVLLVTHSIDEAILLSDRIVVLSPRPGQVQRIVKVDLPRPRGLVARKSASFTQLNFDLTEYFLGLGVLHA